MGNEFQVRYCSRPQNHDPRRQRFEKRVMSVSLGGLCRVATLLLVITVWSSNAQPSDKGEGKTEPLILAESDFLWDDDGWTVRGNASEFQQGNKMVKASDDGADEWYFVAPGKYLGAKRAAYGGKLSFRHGFFEYNSEGQDIQRKHFDVVLISDAYELVVGYRNVIPAWEFRSDHVLELVETAGWISNSTGGPPSRPDMVRVLTKLSAIWIRGGYYAGHESSYIANVKFVAGPNDAAPKSTSLKSQKVVSAEIPPAVTDDSDVPPPPQTPDDELPALDSDTTDDAASSKGKQDQKKKSGMFGGLFGKGKGEDEL